MKNLKYILLCFFFFFSHLAVEPFSEDHIARNVLKNMMKKDIVVNLSPTETASKKNYIYMKGVPSDKFVLILQGKTTDMSW